MRWYVRRVDQGQMVEVAYAYDYCGGAYQRVTDRSERPGSEAYYYGDLDWDREPEHTDHDRAPCVVEWQPCEPPKEEP